MEVTDAITGNGFTTTAFVAKQPGPVVYVMVAAPADSPVVTPVVAPTVAISVLLLVQTPPVTGSVSVMFVPMQSVAGPPMVPGKGSTVKMALAVHPPTWPYK